MYIYTYVRYFRENWVVFSEHAGVTIEKTNPEGFSFIRLVGWGRHEYFTIDPTPNGGLR